MQGTPPTERISAFIEQVRGAGLYPEHPIVNSATTEPVVWVEGRDYLLFCSNNVLGLSSEPRVKAAAAAALERYGLGSGGSRQMAANIDVHLALEARIAAFLHREAAICFAAGYMANVGAIPALMWLDFLTNLNLERMAQGFDDRREAWRGTGRWDLFSEELNHASDIDGIRLAHADVHVYPHKNMAALEAALAAAEQPNKLVLSDGVFSMDGDIAPVRKIAALGRAHGAMVMIDDAHAIGIVGPRGRGTLDHQAVADADVHLLMGTFTKAFGGVGGFVAGDKPLIDFLRVSARTYIFSAPLPPAVAAGVTEAIDIADAEPWRREKAIELAAYLRRELEALGYDTLGSETHIVPALIGTEAAASLATRELRRRGIIAPNVRFPAVAPGRARIRFVTTASHSREQVDVLIRNMAELKPLLEAARAS